MTNKPGRPVGTAKPKTRSTRSISIDDELWERFSEDTYNKSHVIEDLVRAYMKDRS